MPYQEIEFSAPSDDDLLPLLTTTTTAIPALPPFNDTPQTQEWSSFSQDNAKRNRTQISYVNKGILASQTLFLDSDTKVDVEQEEEVERFCTLQGKVSLKSSRLHGIGHLFLR